jgi:cytochrome c553
MLKQIVIAGTIVMAAAGLQAQDAKAIYEKDCAKCHGATGNGDTKMGKKLGVKDYTDAKVQAEMKDEKAIKAIKEGLKDGDKTLMKPLEGATDEQAKALVALFRKFKK